MCTHKKRGDRRKTSLSGDFGLFGLFLCLTATSQTQIILSNDTMIDKQWIVKDMEESFLGLTEDIISELWGIEGKPKASSIVPDSGQSS
jgi:hypothetical protein